MSTQSLSLLYCSLLALQFGLQPLIAQRFTCSVFEGTKVCPSQTSVVVSTEITKLIISISLIVIEPYKSRLELFKNWTLVDSIKLASLPAISYAVQNLLVLGGQAKLDSMTFNLLNQTKTLSTAFSLWIFMGQKQSIIQMLALLLLLSAGKSHKRYQNKPKILSSSFFFFF